MNHPKKLKIVYMGSPEFAVAPLAVLIANPNFDVVAVVTHPDQKAGRKQQLTASPVKITALKNGIPVLQPPSLRKNPEIEKVLQGLKPDFIVVFSYARILPPSILKIPRYGAVNLHPSLLPKYRGATPGQEALLKGDTQTGISFMQMEAKMDSGPILFVQRLAIAPEDNAPTLYQKLAQLGAVLLPSLLKEIAEGIITPISQDETRASYCHKIKKEDGKIDLEKMTAVEIINRIRAFTPWPSCFLEIDGKKIKILAAYTSESLSAKPGHLLEIDKREIGLGTKKGVLIPTHIQMEGKNPSLIQDFLLGNRSFFSKLPTNPK